MIRRPSPLPAILAGGLLVAMLVPALVALRDEVDVASSLAASNGQAPPFPGLGPSLWNPEKAQDIPARSAIAQALVESRIAATLPLGRERDERAGAAVAYLDRAMAVRPLSGEYWVVASFVAFVRSGVSHPSTRDAFARSYREAPFLRDSAGWRIRYGLNQWKSLDAATREHVVDEAAWLSAVSVKDNALVRNIILGTPLEAAVMQRMRDRLEEPGRAIQD